MQLADAFQTPTGLVALLALVPLVVLYLIKPDPRELRLPTLQFLAADEGDGGATPVLERLTRNLLFLLQVLVIVVLALSLASPTASIAQERSAASTVVVLDASASMATETGSGTRFTAARAAASDALGTETTLIVTGGETTTVVDDAPAQRAEEAIATLSVTDGPGDLRSAISRAGSTVGPDSRVVVLSDFVDESSWRSAVRATRARGATVELQQFDGGGGDNVGFVARDVTEQRVTLTAANFGTATAERTVSFAGQSASISPAPGDTESVSFPLPTDGATAELSGDDDFPTDDTVPVAAPSNPTVDVLLLTNDPNRYLVTALEVNDAVSLTVKRPPTTVNDAYDVFIFGDVRADAVLDSTIESARSTAASGGGVAIVAQPDVGQVGYGDLLAIDPEGVREDPQLGSVTRHSVTEGFDFPVPEQYVSGNVSDAQSLVTFDDGSPLLAVGNRGAGRVLYYGYLPDSSAFEDGYRYPVFWKRAVFFLADRPQAATLNRQTGQRLTLGANATITRPDGSEVTGNTLLDTQGYYAAGGQRYSAALLSQAESNVTAPSIEDIATETGDGETTTQQQSVDLTPIAVALAALLLLAELAFLRYRGDL
ncbi:DUF7408 domain-containing protein [Haloarcula sp. GH36]|uniref:DUF7408 domain-containing protein n=1 Tax=Haloarcula montana TaxID=3111776 RepID=UPI002D795004|nr:BatA domain-containing protein [Haloarcula sp. GH36]